jgi:hypothetical protein
MGERTSSDLNRRDRIIIPPVMLHPTPSNFEQLDMLALPNEIKKPFEDIIDMAEESESRREGKKVHIDYIVSEPSQGEISPNNWSVYVRVHFDNGHELNWIMTAEFDDEKNPHKATVTIHQSGELLSRGNKPEFVHALKIPTGAILQKSKDILQHLINQRRQKRSEQTHIDAIRSSLHIL